MDKEQLFIIHYSSFIKFGGVAQLGEHLPCKQGVDSSILFISTRRRVAADDTRNQATAKEWLKGSRLRLEETQSKRLPQTESSGFKARVED